MNELFLKIINMSISSSWLVLAVLILRLVLKKAPKWINVLLWGIVAIRLICPFSIESALSLIPSAETIPTNIGMDTTPTINSGISAINNAVNPIISQSNTPMAGASVNPLQITIGIYEYLWILGMIVLALYTAFSYWCLRRKVDTAVRYKDNIFWSENVSSPFVLGIVKPRIYLPIQMDTQNLEHVIAHENAHILRKDHWWKPLGFLLLILYWFNPLMWLAYVLLCRDIELACDEKVIKELGNEQRANYTQALVDCSVNRRMIAACPLAFGEVGVKERVKSVMNYKKPTFWIIIAALLVCAVVAVCFLTNPINRVIDSSLNYKNAISIAQNASEILVIYCPPSEEVSGGSILMGKATGTELATQLDEWEWSPCDAPKRSLPSPGSVEFVFSNDYRILVHQRKSGSLQQYAVVKFGNETQYYKINATDYSEAVDLVRPHGNVDSTLRAKILEIWDGFFIVEPVYGCRERTLTDKIEVPVEHMESSTEPQVGDLLEIEYDGQIQETYPARITEVYSICVVKAVTQDYEPVGVSGSNVKELSRISGEFESQGGLSFVNLAPGEEITSSSAITFEENSSVMLFITWGAQDLFLEFGMRAEDGTEFFQEKQGGSSILLIEDIPAGTYYLYVKNSDAYNGIPAYENPDAFDGVSFDATGAMNYIINPD